MDQQVPDTVADLLDKAAYPKNAHYALAALQDVRAHLGCVPDEAVPVIAERMGMESAAVIGLMQDSAQFPVQKGVHLLRVCQGAVCIGNNASELLATFRQEFADHTDLQVVSGYCLGHCTQGPAVELDGIVLAPADLESIRKVVNEMD